MRYAGVNLRQSGLAWPAVLLFAGILLVTSCRKDQWYTDPGARLEFSTDTVLFDTVFTAIGSTTYPLVVRNPYRQPVKISEIRLAGGTSSSFRLNIDGINASQARDIELQAHDSLFIFVEVTVNPNGQNSPLVIQDSILFELNGNLQDVDLVAFGQDYHLVNGEFVQTQTWVNDKPYLIYNSMAVDTNQVLTISKGCRLHFHHGSSLFVLGTLKVEGTLDEPVVFQGDRLEEMYEDLPGQWGYIHLLAGSRDNEINYAVIKNGIIGIQVDTFFNAAPSLKISNSEIRNMNAVGIFAQGAHIQADNCLISDCGQFCLALTIGGRYVFSHCTIANYWAFGTRTTPALVLNNYYQDIYGTYQVRALEQADFRNCLVYGNRENEIVFDQYPEESPVQNAQFRYFFDHCLVRLDAETAMPEEGFLACFRNKDPGFVSAFEGNFELDTLSFAKDKGNPEIGLLFPVDIKGVNRVSDSGPDPGCFERVDGRK